MKTFSKRFFSLFLILTMIVSLVPFFTFSVFAETAASGTCGFLLEWNYDVSTCTLTINNTGSSIGQMYAYNYGEVPWFDFKDSIKVVNGYGVKYVGKNAFTNSASLKSVNFPDALEIGNYAFKGCSSLIFANLPDALKIGDYAFKDCSSLRSVVLCSEVHNNAIIGNEAFAFCNSLSTIVFPFYSGKIGRAAFSGCDELKTLGIDNNAEIDDYAFWGCSNLSSIYMLRNGIPFTGNVSNNAFSDVNADVYCNYSYFSPKQESKFGGRFTYKKMTSGILGYQAYWNYDQTNEELTVFGEGKLFRYFGGSQLPWMNEVSGVYSSEIKTIKIEEGITEIPSYSFEYMGNVKSVTLPDTLLKLYPNAFNDCSSLTEIVIPSSVEYVDGNSYWYRSGIKNVYYIGTEEEWNEIYVKGNISKTVSPHFLVYHPSTQSCFQAGYPAHYEFDGTENNTFYDLNKNVVPVPETSKLEHSFGLNWQSDTECHWQTCSICGEADNYEAHIWDDGIVIQNPNNSSGSVKLFTCTVCGATRTEPFHIPGDITGDGVVNSKDLTRLLKYVSGEDVTVNDEALDVNGDGIVNSKDLTRLLKYLSGVDVIIF